MARNDDCLLKTAKQHKQTTRRKSIMKYGKIVTLTLAATMLVAMAGANAFATTYSYPGEFATVLSTDNSVSLTYHSAGDIDVSSTSDHLVWYNGFKNRHSSSATVDVTQSTSPANGLNGVTTIIGLSIPYTPPDGLGIYDQQVEYQVANTASHTINAYHVWHYGGTYTSPVNDQMKYH